MSEETYSVDNIKTRLDNIEHRLSLFRLDSTNQVALELYVDRLRELGRAVTRCLANPIYSGTVLSELSDHRLTVSRLRNQIANMQVKYAINSNKNVHRVWCDNASVATKVRSEVMDAINHCMVSCNLIKNGKINENDSVFIEKAKERLVAVEHMIGEVPGFDQALYDDFINTFDSFIKPVEVPVRKSIWLLGDK